jgi:uncharacterized membrane protein
MIGARDFQTVLVFFCCGIGVPVPYLEGRDRESPVLSGLVFLCVARNRQLILTNNFSTTDIAPERAQHARVGISAV